MANESHFASTDAEQTVIGSIIIDSRKLSVCRRFKLTEEWFSDARLRNAWNVITGMEQDRKPISEISIYEEAKKKNMAERLPDLAACVDKVTSVSHVEFYTEILKEKYVRRFLRQQYQEGINELSSDKSSHELLTQQRFNLNQFKVGRTIKLKPAEIIKKITARIRESRRQGFIGLPCRWYPLQKVLGGWWKAKMSIVAGRPSQGKSTLMHNTTLDLGLKKIPTGIISLEMGIDELWERMSGDRASIDVFKLNDGSGEEADVDRLERVGLEIAKLPIHIVDDIRTIDQICGAVRDMKSEYNVELVAVDYIQLIQDTITMRKSETRNEQMSRWSNALMTVAAETGVHVMVLSQLTRHEKESKEPQLQHLRDCGALEQDAQQVVFVYKHPDLEDEEWYDNQPTIFKIAKNRGGPRGKVDFKFEKTKQRFTPKEVF